MKAKRISHILIFLSVLLMTLPALLAIWTAQAEARAHYVPECARTDLRPILEKEGPDEEDYAILFQQTGLARPGVDELYASGQQWKLLGLQERFLAETEIECICGDFFVRSERLSNFRELINGVDFCFLPTVQTGDVLITFSGHIFGWRSGHAAIVVDAENRLTLEAIMPGYDSAICSLDAWQEYPGFALLRLKEASEEEREQIAAYARECLTGLPYCLTAFADRKGEGSLAADSSHAEQCPEEDSLTGTQCAHLVWYAYMHFGYDLDSDGGFVVTPEDLYRSDLLEPVQIYGLKP